MNSDQYRRLPGRSGPIIRNSLWIGAGHLLSVRRNPFSESYRRFYFTDIQAIVLTELPNATEFYGYTAAGLLALTTAALFYTRHPAWGCLCGLAALAALFAGWRTKNCSCYIQTSTSVEKLPSLGRRKQAAIAVARLTAEIEQSQGRASPELLLSPLPPALAPAARVSKLLPPLRHCGGQLHWVAFSLMLLRGAIAIVSLVRLSISMPMAIVTAVVGTSLLILLILAVIQQRRSDLALGIRRTVVAALVFYVASGLASFAVSIYIVIELGPKVASQTALENSPALQAHAIADLAGFLAIGCIGLVLMWRHRRAAVTPPPLELGSGG